VSALKVQIRIEHLVVEGLGMSPLSHGYIEAAVQAELARLFGARGVPASWSNARSIESMKQDAMLGPGGLEARSLGTALGQAVYRGFGA
jgi:hypothetical protein